MDQWGLVPQIRHGNVFILKEENKKRLIGFAILMREWENVDTAYLFLNNPPAIKLYQDKLGFEIIEHRKDEYGKGHDRYIMELNLDKFKK